MAPATDSLAQLAQRIAGRLNAVDPAWKRGYLRVEMIGERPVVTASIERWNGGEVLDMGRHGAWVRALAVPLRQAQLRTQAEARPFRVALLMVDATWAHMVAFDYDNPDRWHIPERGHSAGIPWGL